MILRRYLRAICLVLFVVSVCLIVHLLHSSCDDASADLHLERNYGYFDATGKFKILSHVQVATNWTQLSKEPLCLAVQSSLDHAFRLVELVASWPGAVSCALFAPGQEFSLTLALLSYLRRCHPAVGRQVNFHVVYPTRHPPGRPVRVSQLRLSCGLRADEVVRHLLRMRTNRTVEWRRAMPYPQNVLRNVARAHCANQWVMCPDVDMVLPPPSPHSHLPAHLNHFLKGQKSCAKCAFVLPVYEIDDSVKRLPCNKSELMRLSKAKVARPYHKKAFSLNQRSTNFSRWERMAAGAALSVAYAVDNFIFHYEPVYVAKRGTPPFDERYIGYGMTRNTQAYEMLLANYTFYVLNNAFLSHWGFQLKRIETSKAKFRQVQHNHRLFFPSHLRELAAKYDRDPIGLLAAQTGDSRGAFQVRVEPAAAQP